MDNSQALAQLHEIHLPTPIGWWPLAPGWYVLTLCFLLAITGLMFSLYRRHTNGKPKREAIHLLKCFEQQYQKNPQDSQIISARVSELLKRVALAYYPRTTVAGLQGDAWIAFLNEKSHNLDFQMVEKELLELPYQSARASDLGLLFRLTHSWILQRGKPCLN